MAKATVEAGICGFVTSIEAVPEERGKVRLSLETACPSLKPLVEELTLLDGMKECFAPVGDSPVFHLARKYCKHAACPVPIAIV